ncbi:uncharacterized protein M6B38_260430 [Iris pallida]|uniref:DUF7963 domain-containing protein n=1 Tax=Iris pallida TaxID=29817 RepID=A0AAX6IDT3_IRIPA|nr:uncharacterized protein M6B38_260425 [Iris pallida]KAJ6851083.1 uncharacterized protein M6B38_260430 [Iris pallida]
MAETKEGAAASSAVAGEGATAIRRYESLVTIRTKAINGKGAWYWAYLEPLLATDDSGAPRAAKIRCSLCDAVFSASNPSRTASEHLKRGSCPNFSSSSPQPISSAPPLHSPSRKRTQKLTAAATVSASASPSPLLLPCVLHQQQQQKPHVALSGGKDDFGALAMLEDCVKRLKSPTTVPVQALPKPQADSALALFSDWLLESCGRVAPSSLSHPKLRDFFSQVGLPPPVSPRRLLGPTLDSRYRAAAADSEAKLRDAHFFQLASAGWKDRGFVNVAANLPNGTSVFVRAIAATAPVPPDYAQELLWDAVSSASIGIAERCVGIVSDRYKSKALRNLEARNQWMVNLSCQVQGLSSLVKDFVRELPIFETVATNCLKVANFFNSNSQARTIFHKYQLREFDHARLLRAPTHLGDTVRNLGPVYSMLEDIVQSMNPLQMSVLDEDYKVVRSEESQAKELGEMVQDVRFWNELEAVWSLLKLVKDTAREVEAERPLAGQCLPLWNELRSKVKGWCARFGMEVGPAEKVVERRFKKNYHPAWSAAYILDPFYLVKDASGKYLPPFKMLSPEQDKDVDRLITRLVSREEAHIVLMELMKWRSEGLDPLYAKAVQFKEPDPATGKMRIANPQSSRLVWETCLSELKLLRKVAVRLIFLHATALCGLKPDPPVLRWVGDHRRSRTALDRAQKMVFVAAHAKLERRDFSTEEKDAELFGEGEEDAMDEPPVDPPSL